jgi:hypothetical protein
LVRFVHLLTGETILVVVYLAFGQELAKKKFDAFGMKLLFKSLGACIDRAPRRPGYEYNG